MCKDTAFLSIFAKNLVILLQRYALHQSVRSPILRVSAASLRIYNEKKRRLVWK